MMKIVDRMALLVAGLVVVYETFQETPNLAILWTAIFVGFIAAVDVADISAS